MYTVDYLQIWHEIREKIPEVKVVTIDVRREQGWYSGTGCTCIEDEDENTDVC